MKQGVFITAIVVFVAIVAVHLSYRPQEPNLSLEGLRLRYSQDKKPSVDHTKFPILQQTFESAEAVTAACLTCHTERHKEIMEGSHWNWERISYIEGRGIEALGKGNAVNNYCIGSKNNEQACAKCHIGFGAKTAGQVSAEANKVDCMVCHDNSQEYIKGSAMAGYPDRNVNLNAVAQHVGRPGNSNCGSCHFYSGGGNNVKHGDLEEEMANCSRNIDVHMATDGINMQCADCHGGENHKLKGRLFSVSSTNTNRATCEQCHGNTPHLTELLNTHTARIACQTCHIPEYAKASATKMEWHWSEAGKLKNGQPFHTEDSMGNHSYTSEKGRFVWAKNVKPDYIWFNGTAKHYLFGDVITDTTQPLKINELLGAHNDPESKIFPVKIHRGDQPYDPVNKILVHPVLFDPNAGDSAFWKGFDWQKSVHKGMKQLGLPYSGQLAFHETEMYWPVNHQVAPAEQSLGCEACHSSTDSRLAHLTGFYLPGRDRSVPLDIAGIAMVMLTIAGIVVHGGLRIVYSIKSLKPTDITTETDIEENAE